MNLNPVYIMLYTSNGKLGFPSHELGSSVMSLLFQGRSSLARDECYFTVERFLLLLSLLNISWLSANRRYEKEIFENLVTLMTVAMFI